MKRLLLALAVLAAVALLAGAIALRWAATLPAVRSWGERVASQALDLEVSLDGEVQPSLGLPIGLRLTDVGLVMRADQDRREQLRASFAELRIGLDPRPLLVGGEVRVSHVVGRGGEIFLQDPVVLVLEDYFGPEEEDDDEDESDEVPPLRFEDVRVEFPTGLGGRRRLELTEARLNDGESLLSLAGEWQDLPFSISARVRTLRSDRMAVEDLVASLAEDAATGALDLDLSRARPRLEGRLRADGLQPARVLERLGEAGNDRDPVHEPIPIDDLEALDLDLELELSQVTLPELRPMGFVGRLKTEAGALEVVATRLELMGGTGRASLTARPEAAGTHLALSADLEGLALEQILVSEGTSVVIDGDLDLRLSLRAAGRTPRDLLRRSSGSIHVEMGRAVSSDDRIGLLGKTPLAMLLSIVGDDDQLVLNCGVAHIELSEGDGPMETLVDTPDVTLRGTGGLSLAELEMDQLVRPRRKRAGVGAFNTPLRVSGPLDDLEVSAETGQVARRTGKRLLFGLVNPALIVVPLVDLGSADDNPCLAALATGVIPEEEPRKGLFDRWREPAP